MASNCTLSNGCCARHPRLCSQNSFPWTGTTAAIEVIVCRYSEAVHWLKDMVGNSTLSSARGLVVNHGSALHADALSQRVSEWRVANTGNECGCYLQFITERYPTFAPTTLFLQADAHRKLACLSTLQLPFAYLGRNEWRSMSGGDTDRTCPGYNARSCELSLRFGEQCERTTKGLMLVGPGHANFQVSRERLLRHSRSVWTKLAAAVDGTEGRFGQSKCSNRARTRWFDCLVMERLWHVMMGEPRVLPARLALSLQHCNASSCPRCENQSPFPCEGCAPRLQPGRAERSSVVVR
jgi:hypothetical protein